jgi:cellulose synthase/poly-beta-1,6-N-acetylglucosamine synthase-like glycosyltransferase
MIDLTSLGAGVGAIATLLSLPGSLTLGTLSAAALWPKRNPLSNAQVVELADVSQLPQLPALAIVVPAHNESASITSTINNLLAECQRDGHAHLWVIADNCTDDTAARAQTAGAQVLERNDAQLRGKGHALEFAFATLASRQPELAWFIVIDADSHVDQGFLAAMRAAMRPGVNALQACYLSRPAQSLKARLGRLGQFGFNLVRPLGRARLGASVGILGNGFALRRELTQAVVYDTHSVVEDLEYHLKLIRAGHHVQYVPVAQVWGEMAESASGARQQRARWEGGRLRLVRERSGSLLREVLSGQWQWLEPLSDLWLLPMGLHVLLLALTLLAQPVWMALGSGLGVMSLSLYVTAIFIRGPVSQADGRALLLAPVFIAWKLSLLPLILWRSRRQAAWVRSERVAEAASASNASTRSSQDPSSSSHTSL